MPSRKLLLAHYDKPNMMVLSKCADIPLLKFRLIERDQFDRSTNAVLAAVRDFSKSSKIVVKCPHTSSGRGVTFVSENVVADDKRLCTVLEKMLTE